MPCNKLWEAGGGLEVAAREDGANSGPGQDMANPGEDKPFSSLSSADSSPRTSSSARASVKGATANLGRSSKWRVRLSGKNCPLVAAGSPN